jgi:hypothetical protein
MEKNEKPKAPEAVNEQEIKPGVPVKVEGETRAEVADKIKEMRSRAAEQGLKDKEGGFIHHVDGNSFDDPGIFTAEMIFIKK